MRASDIRVLRTMAGRCYMFKLILFQILVVSCSAKHVAYITDSGVDLKLEDGVQDNIRNLMHTGIYSHKHLDPSRVEVVTPIKVDREGELVSHHVDHSHEHGHARARRDLHGLDHTMPHILHYNLTVGGRHIRLDLRPSVTFITPAMMVERHSAGSRTRHRPDAASTSCHYTGSVRGQPGSSVAVSACDGLAGLLQTQHGEYWIEPSNQILTDKSEGRPHVLFKRSAVDKVAAYHRDKSETSYKQTTHYNNRHFGNDERNKYTKVANRKKAERKQQLDKKRREYLENRRRQMEELRKDPAEYRRRQMRLQMKQGRLQSMSKSTTESKSNELSLESRRNKSMSKNSNHKGVRPRKRRKRRKDKNCGTRQPPYRWDKKKQNDTKNNNNKNRRFGKNLQQTTEGKRPTRSVSKPQHVEVLLVADRSMSEFHNQSNIETYLLTIMNMVSSLYMDPSIGNYIKVVVVKIILIEESNAAPELDVSTNADATLSSFCRWQQQLNPDNDLNPHHHDVAILVTRKNICSINDAPCSTLGVAHVAGMCKPDRSCSVNEDNGIMLAHTITHELGHNFGLYHDTEKIGCHRREGATLHIMTPVFEADIVQVSWSKCSKRDVTNFLDAGLGECLGDTPSQEEYVYPEVPAGVTFDAATQCHLQFAYEAAVCADAADLCVHLWCLVNNTCKTMLRPAAPGTTCGPDMWCQDLKCVPRAPSPEPRDGGWGNWDDWSPCSRSCGAGVSTQTRLCDSPAPTNNGHYCIGDRSRYKVCNTDPCPINEPTFREVQCAQYNNITYNNKTITDWVPYFDQDKPCELHCVPRNRNDVEVLNGFVADGTPCRQNLAARDLCISGVCYKVGCDWVVDSSLEEDACGECGGDGSKCRTVQGIYSKGTARFTGYSEVAVIPAGSRNVKIKEKVSPENFISIGSANTKRVYLNGARNATLTEYLVAGSQAVYERDRDWEKVRIQGPITEDIKVYQRIYRGRHRNPGVAYQYTVDRHSGALGPSAEFRYALEGWGACSVSCGRGYLSRRYICQDYSGNTVDMSNCYHLEGPRIVALRQQCGGPPCRNGLDGSRHGSRSNRTNTAYVAREATRWWPEAWGPCSPTCRRQNVTPLKHRKVYCVDTSLNQIVENSRCNIERKPSDKMICADIPSC